MHQLLLSVAHSKDANIRVAFTSPPEAPDKTGAGINVFVDYARESDKLWRFWNPTHVTKWFENNSRAHLAAWQSAYHRSGLKAEDFQRPVQEKANDFVLDVPYFSQRDNRLNPNGACNVTCYAMNLAYLGARRQNTSYAQFEDELNAWLRAKGKDRHVHDDLATMGRAYGMEARFNVNRTWEQIRNELHQKRPVIVSTQYTHSGHIIIIIGLKGDDFVVHDPWGDARTGYKDRNGRALVYSYQSMHEKTKACGKNAKWAHFIAAG